MVAAIDEYARTKKYLMNVGSDKGRIVSELISEVKPKTLVELGGYVGYSSILFGDAFRSAGGQRYYTLEHNPEFGAVIGSLVDLAGLSDIVKVVVGDSGASLERMHREQGLKRIDLLFIDHTQFERDIKLAERLGMISEGSVVAADNCIYPGHPEYWQYMTASVDEKRKSRQAAKSEEEVGNPELIYDSNLVHSFEPSGEKVRAGHSRVRHRTDLASGCRRYLKMQRHGDVIVSARVVLPLKSVSFLFAILLSLQRCSESVRPVQ